MLAWSTQGILLWTSGFFSRMPLGQNTSFCGGYSFWPREEMICQLRYELKVADTCKPENSPPPGLWVLGMSKDLIKSQDTGQPQVRWLR